MVWNTFTSSSIRSIPFARSFHLAVANAIAPVEHRSLSNKLSDLLKLRWRWNRAFHWITNEKTTWSYSVLPHESPLPYPLILQISTTEKQPTEYRQHWPGRGTLTSESLESDCFILVRNNWKSWKETMEWSFDKISMRSPIRSRNTSKNNDIYIKNVRQFSSTDDHRLTSLIFFRYGFDFSDVLLLLLL